jgi:hypothetical protein
MTLDENLRGSTSSGTETALLKTSQEMKITLSLGFHPNH